MGVIYVLNTISNSISYIISIVRIKSFGVDFPYLNSNVMSVGQHDGTL